VIVCHCHRVSDTVIRELAPETSSVEEITGACGAGGRCGGCLPTLWAMFDATRAPAASQELSEPASG
jgi:bacterioferritin-associated ferredoxin